MNLSGIGMTDTLDLRIHPGYKVKTNYALEWFQLADGNWVATDRGTNSDTYDADISLFGDEDRINEYLDQIQNMRDVSQYEVQMTNFALDERIFGEDIDYTNLSGLITKIGSRKQNTFKGFTTTLALRALSPAFSGVASLPNFTDTCVNYGYINNRDYAYTIKDTYKGDMFVNYQSGTNSIFRGTYNLTNEELRDIRRWYAVNRDTSFTVTDMNGIAYMFGPEEGTYNHDVKILNIKEQSKHGLFRWIVNIDMCKVY